MSARDLDDIDRRILSELRSNARISHARLGEIVRLSRNAVRQRIEHLERDRWIGGYTIREGALDSAAPRVFATLLVDRADRMRGADVIAVLSSIPEVVHCDVVAGTLDLIVRVEAGDAARIQQIWRQIADLPGVRDITTALTLSTPIDR
jgi:DNA-binding Lrp family transcriptional regulator